jgi:hypothetical protein
VPIAVSWGQRHLAVRAKPCCTAGGTARRRGGSCIKRNAESTSVSTSCNHQGYDEVCPPSSLLSVHQGVVWVFVAALGFDGVLSSSGPDHPPNTRTHTHPPPLARSGAPPKGDSKPAASYLDRMKKAAPTKAPPTPNTTPITTTQDALTAQLEAKDKRIAELEVLLRDALVELAIVKDEGYTTTESSSSAAAGVGAGSAAAGKGAYTALSTDFPSTTSPTQWTRLAQKRSHQWFRGEGEGPRSQRRRAPVER